jgi:hypothetical protein
LAGTRGHFDLIVLRARQHLAGTRGHFDHDRRFRWFGPKRLRFL